MDKDGEPRLTGKHILELKAGLRSFDDFVELGLIEFLDVNEENDVLASFYRREILKGFDYFNEMCLMQNL